MKVIVTGGGGYIGSFMVKALCDRGEEVFVIDNFQRGYKDAVDSRAQIFQGDLLDKNFVESTLATVSPESIVHFAGLISVGESMKFPGLYLESNIMGALNLIEYIKSKNVKFIFSSTAAVYGNPTKIPIPEDHLKNPTSPYGVSKLMVEDILKWYSQLFGLSVTVLRYFNASGAALDGSMGERHNPETHIIPNAIRSLLFGKQFSLFGVDYATPDGTCVRDYIHVLDLVEAHLLALDKMKPSKMSIYNVGTGKGFSNKQVVQTVEDVSGKMMEVVTRERRSGDPDELVADPALIKSELGFEPQHSDIQTIVSSAFKWHQKEFHK